MKILDELKRRNVIKVAVTYLAGSWLFIQILETLLPVFGAAETSMRWVVIALAIGLVPVMIFSWLFEVTPGGIQRDEDAPRSAVQGPTNRKTMNRVIIVTLTLALGYFAVDKFILDPDRDATRERAVAEQSRADALVDSYGDRSIAVLAFVNMSSDPEQEYFSDGIAEEILNLLAQIPKLRVISRSSAFVFKGQNVEIPVIADKLNVAHILEGSVRKSGNRIRITAQLIDARTDTHLWSETFEREFVDVFAIQDEISARVVDQLKIKILGSTPTSERVDPEAYALFLRARYILHSEQIDNMDLAAELLDEVLKLAPEYTPAISDLARVYYRLGADTFASWEDREQAIYDMAARISVIAPDSRLDLAWRSWFARTRDNDLQLSATLMERALALDPGNVETLRPMVWLLAKIGRLDDAIAVAKFVVDRDPACASCLGNLARLYGQAGRYHDAVVVLQSTIDWWPNLEGLHLSLGAALLLDGDPAAALAAFEQDPAGGRGSSARIMALHDLGRQAEFEDEFSSFRSEHPDDYEGFARILAWTGDNDKALEWLDKHFEQNDLNSLGIGYYDKLQLDPRYAELLRKHGLDRDVESEVTFTFELPE